MEIKKELELQLKQLDNMIRDYRTKEEKAILMLAKSNVLLGLQKYEIDLDKKYY